MNLKSIFSKALMALSLGGSLAFSMEALDSAEKVKVIFYNIDAIDSGEKWMSKDYSYPPFPVRLENILKRIDEEKADVVSLSEAAFFSEHKEQLVEGFKKIGFDQHSPTPGELSNISSFFSYGVRSFLPSTFAYRNSGLIIFVNKRHRLARCATHTYYNSAGRDLVANKGALFCEIELNKDRKFDRKRTLYLVSTHLQAGDQEAVYAQENSARAGQFRELRWFIADNVPLQSHPLFLVGGDLNFDYLTSEYSLFNEIMNEDEKDGATNLGLANIHSKNAWDKENEMSRPKYSTAVDWDVIIDHVYAPKSFLSHVSLRVNDVLSFDKKAQKQVTNSDHKMMVVEIEPSALPFVHKELPKK